MQLQFVYNFRFKFFKLKLVMSDVTKLCFGQKSKTENVNYLAENDNFWYLWTKIRFRQPTETETLISILFSVLVRCRKRILRRNLDFDLTFGFSSLLKANCGPKP